jgi:hypothetical protein
VWSYYRYAYTIARRREEVFLFADPVYSRPMLGRVGVVLIVVALAAIWVAAIYYFYWHPTSPSALLPLPLGK